MELCVFSMTTLLITLASTQQGADLWAAGILRGWELTTFLPVLSSCALRAPHRTGTIACFSKNRWMPLTKSLRAPSQNRMHALVGLIHCRMSRACHNLNYCNH